MSNGNDGSPIVVSSNPIHGSGSVPIDLNRILIVFNDEMITTSYSLAWNPSSFQHKIKKTQFIDTNTFEIQLKANEEDLEYGTSYKVILNPGNSKNFKNTGGFSLGRNTEIAFTTQEME
ncbi:MAG: hypothetical protein CVV46_02425 [Spirochaetae bacterium HGW-Spirochaetae-2]|jgi:hypothetical protein|nr:MAG: hypothetical protein CVV46_02425 [Spirochaetae bacterium HGW-Spirochaetae-2]